MGLETREYSEFDETSMNWKLFIGTLIGFGIGTYFLQWFITNPYLPDPDHGEFISRNEMPEFIQLITDQPYLMPLAIGVLMAGIISYNDKTPL